MFDKLCSFTDFPVHCETILKIFSYVIEEYIYLRAHNQTKSGKIVKKNKIDIKLKFKEQLSKYLIQKAKYTRNTFYSYFPIFQVNAKPNTVGRR